MLFTRGSPPASPAGSGDNSLAGHASSPATAVPDTTQATQATSPPAAITGATIPAAFAGSWKGTATMSPVGATTISLTNPITFTFVAGARTAREENQDCVNTLTLTSATDTTLVFSEPQTANCVAGTTTFTRHGSSLAYRWTDDIEQNTATLRRG